MSDAPPSPPPRRSGAEDVPVKEPLLIGELFAGAEALLVVAVPLGVLSFCVVHTVQVQGMVRAVRGTLPPNTELSVWSVIVDPGLILISLMASFIFSSLLVMVTGVGVVLWRLIAWQLDRASLSRSRRRYDALDGEVVLEADAWGAQRAEGTVGTERPHPGGAEEATESASSGEPEVR